MKMQKVTELCDELGIELRGDDGQPYHCDDRMETRGGIMGTDMVTCLNCGLQIMNAASPHINGGHIPEKQTIERGDTWFRNDV